MTEIIANNAQPKPVVKCDVCDTEVEHYVTFVTPANEIRNVCWACQQRDDKGFNTKPDWKRSVRQRQINSVTKE